MHSHTRPTVCVCGGGCLCGQVVIKRSTANRKVAGSSPTSTTGEKNLSPLSGALKVVHGGGLRVAYIYPICGSSLHFCVCMHVCVCVCREYKAVAWE